MATDRHRRCRCMCLQLSCDAKDHLAHHSRNKEQDLPRATSAARVDGDLFTAVCIRSTPTCSVVLMLLPISGLFSSLMGSGYSSPEACTGDQHQHQQNLNYQKTKQDHSTVYAFTRARLCKVSSAGCGQQAKHAQAAVACSATRLEALPAAGKGHRSVVHCC